MTKEFGTCRRDLADAMQAPPHSLLRVENNGVLSLAVGFAKTEQGVGWYDQAVLFCPFCGEQLQDREGIRKRIGEPAH
jgi:hypothetical protein